MGCLKLPYYEKEDRPNFLGLWKKSERSKSCDNYYPFGLTFNSYKRENSIDNRIKFQGQEHIEDLDLGWAQFKWRNHMPDIGRFFNVDPLAEKFYFNSPYAFSENKTGLGIELEGLELLPFNVISQGSAAIVGFLASQGMKTTEIKAVLDHPVGTALIYDQSNREIAENFAVESGLPGNHNGEADALRHALFNALNTQTAGEETAKALGDAHEEDRPQQPAGEKEMDLFNNEVGRQLGKDNPDATPKRLTKMLIDKIVKGELKVLDSNGNLVNSSADKKKAEEAKKKAEQLTEYGEKKEY